MISEIEKQYFNGSYGFMANNVKTTNKIKKKPMPKEKLIKQKMLKFKMLVNSKPKNSANLIRPTTINNANNKKIRLEKLRKTITKTQIKPVPKPQPTQQPVRQQTQQKSETRINNTLAIRLKQKKMQEASKRLRRI